ncbi:MAG: zinc carboxypeptidase [Lewinellaceae bacterium]|nr:zinc carboxypeptidase [Lewinellaceae bacterium]
MKLRLLFWAFLLQAALYGQEKNDLKYYLPDIPYNPAIPTPSQYLGYEVGDWHVSHDLLVGYMRELARSSDRVQLREYGRSHEKRPMLCLTITAPANHARLDDIRSERRKLADPAQSGKADIKSMPAVNYMGYSIHGNEASGSNASLLVAYYLAAGQSAEIEQLLQHTVVLLDPCFNPDGMQRFSAWVNSRKSTRLVPDPAGDEFNEPWPRGRYNHYWFDLNRDWLVTRQPESIGRVAIFQEWRPNVLTDHHEMGSNSTFFFQPGVPSRVNPITPAKNQALTAKIAGYHAAMLSGKNILFYTQENFDDFYYGKGSTYPDANGSIGILFEQASSRGSAQETQNGLLTFPYSIRNQVLASMSTLKAVSEMRVELNEYQREFFQTAVEEARKDDIKGFVFSGASRDLPARELLSLLMSHQIDVRNTNQDMKINGQLYPAGTAFWVPAEQPNYRLIKGIFNRQTVFQDSIFYDISAWTLPDAFGLQWSPVKASDLPSGWKPQAGIALTSRYGVSTIATPAYAYAMDAVGYELPQVLGELLEAGIRVKVAAKAFEADGHSYSAGSLVIPTDRQPLSPTELLNRMNRIESELPVYIITNGLTSAGPDLGSENFPVIRPPKILLLTGRGVTPESAGEIWHLLDTRYHIPVTMVEINRLDDVKMLKYNVIILAEGNYSSLSADKIRQFVQNGGTVIGIGNALKWLDKSGLLPLEFKTTAPDNISRRSYDGADEDLSARRLPGSIFEAGLDLTHPICFGYERDRLPVFLGDSILLELPKNPYAAPVAFTEKPLLAGYLHPKFQPLVKNAAAVVVGGVGSGRIIGFAGNPNFRAFWYGTNRLFANAIFFGNLISRDAIIRNE